MQQSHLQKQQKVCKSVVEEEVEPQCVVVLCVVILNLLCVVYYCVLCFVLCVVILNVLCVVYYCVLCFVLFCVVCCDSQCSPQAGQQQEVCKCVVEEEVGPQLAQSNPFQGGRATVKILTQLVQIHMLVQIHN